jgi:hypothetical protein
VIGYLFFLFVIWLPVRFRQQKAMEGEWKVGGREKPRYFSVSTLTIPISHITSLTVATALTGVQFL